MLFYGCDIATDSHGQALLGDIASLTGAEVAASDDLTSSSEKGGDWELEYQSGDIEAEASVSQNAQLSWNRLFDITSGLIGHWTFDSDGTDSSISGYDGILAGDAATDNNHRIGSGSISLDGADDYLDLSSYAVTLGTLSEGTIAGWINTSDTTNTQTIFGIADLSPPLTVSPPLASIRAS